MEENMNNEVMEENVNAEENTAVEVVEEKGNNVAAIALAATGIGGLIVGAVILTKKVIIPAIRRRKEAKFATLRGNEEAVDAEEVVEK
jgi:hypothetical protein